MFKLNLRELLKNLRSRSKPIEKKAQIPEEWVNGQEPEQDVEESVPVASKPVFIFPQINNSRMYQIPYKFKRILAVTLLLVTIISLFGSSSTSTLAFYLANLVPPLDYLIKTHRKKAFAHLQILPDIERGMNIEK